MSQNPPQAPTRTVKNVVSSADHAALEEAYTFIPESKSTKESSWKDRMVQRYHDGLYKEYALADLSPSRPGQVGLRWRTKEEVVNGRGELTCGNKQCENTTTSDELITLEVPFAYKEGGVSKKELVKLKLCPICKPLIFPKKSSPSGKKRISSDNNKRKNEESDGNDDDDDSYSSRSSSTSSNSSQHKQRSRKNRKRHKNKRNKRHERDRKRRRRDYSSSSDSSERSDSRSRKRHERSKDYR